VSDWHLEGTRIERSTLNTGLSSPASQIRHAWDQTRF
jgi:hypothetical protein